MKKSELKTLIKKIISELQDEDSEIHEINTTGNIEGYQTPHAFSSDDEEEHKKGIKSTAEVFDYKSTENKKTNTVKLNEGKVYFIHLEIIPICHLSRKWELRFVRSISY